MTVAITVQDGPRWLRSSSGSEKSSPEDDAAADDLVALDDSMESGGGRNLPEELPASIKKTNDTLWPMVAMAISQSIYSGWHILGARVLKSVPEVHVVSFTVVRQILSYLVLVVVARCKEGHIPLPTSKSERYMLLMGGCCGACFMPLFYLSGLMHTTPTVAAVWDGPMLPVLMFVITLALGIEQLNKHNLFVQVISLATTVLGSMLVLLGDFHHHKTSHQELDMWDKGKFYEFINGNIMLAAMVGSYSVMCLAQRSMASGGNSASPPTSPSSRRTSPTSPSGPSSGTANKITDDYPPLTLTSWFFGVGAVCNIVLVAIFGSSIPGGVTLYQVYDEISQAMFYEDHSGFFCLGLLYAVCLMSAFINVSVSYSSKYLESSVVTLFSAGQPPITVLLEHFLFGKAITDFKIMGMFMVAFGMFFFTSSKNSVNKKTY
mmetsp:Transcript_24499/g.35857  ORF Transcript_24499/g.35857 Transcript_24499/m.35857 type:complete len:434 (+) Transcript_24499:64-1365(+)